MIARWFGTIQPGQVSAAMVSNINLLPTRIEIAGGEAPTDLDGHSFKVRPGYGPDKFYLDWTDYQGTYEYTIQNLIHHI